MTNEDLLNKEIYCPEIIDLRIVVYLKLGFKVLFMHYSKFSTERGSYILLTYQHDVLSEIDISNLIDSRKLCACASLQLIKEIRFGNNITTKIDGYYFINNKLVWPMFIGANQILELETHIITNYENKDK